MDNNIYTYIEDTFKPKNLDPCFITEDSSNIPEDIRYKLDTNIIYDFNDFENLVDDSHDYLQRAYDGTLHDKDSVVRYFKRLYVRVYTNKDLKYGDEDSTLLVKRFYISNKHDKDDILVKRIKDIINKFVRGDITPSNSRILPIYSGSVSVTYDIGNIDIYSHYHRNLKATEYFVALPYKATCKEVGSDIISKKVAII